MHFVVPSVGKVVLVPFWFLLVVLLHAVCYRRGCFWANVRVEKGTVMPVAVRIEAGKYGSAIGLLLKRGGAFQTRHERTLIVDVAQRKVLEQAGLIEFIRSRQRSGKEHGQKKDGG